MTQDNNKRVQFVNATKEEKARHNGVDTSRWGNDAPRIAVPTGWQDHQHTQQLIRKYLRNEDVEFDIEARRLTIYVTKEEAETLFSIPSTLTMRFKEGEKYVSEVEFKDNGTFVSNWSYCNCLKCSFTLSRTALGFCINKYILREYQRGDVLIKPAIGTYIHSSDFRMDYTNCVFDEVSLAIRK